MQRYTDEEIMAALIRVGEREMPSDEAIRSFEIPKGFEDRMQVGTQRRLEADNTRLRKKHTIRKRLAIAAILLLTFVLWNHRAIAATLPRHVTVNRGEHLEIQRTSNVLFEYRTSVITIPPGFEELDDHRTKESEEHYYESDNGTIITILLTYPEFTHLTTPEGVTVTRGEIGDRSYQTYQKGDMRYYYTRNLREFIQVSGTAEEDQLLSVLESIKIVPVNNRTQIDAPISPWMWLILVVMFLNLTRVIYINRFARYETHLKNIFWVMTASLVIGIILWIVAIALEPVNLMRMPWFLVWIAPGVIILILDEKLRPERERIEKAE